MFSLTIWIQACSIAPLLLHKYVRSIEYTDNVYKHQPYCYTASCVCRLVCKFNHTHTVGDVRRHIAASRPQYAGVAFSLITTLPSRQLTDDTVTLKEADLLNAAIMQKL